MEVVTETLNIEPEQVVPTVIAQWAFVDGEQIGRLARDMWSKWSLLENFTDEQQNGLMADASILASLQLCKKLVADITLPALQKLWRGVKDGEDGANFGGLIHGEDSPRYGIALDFAEKLFLPAVQHYFTLAFDKAAEKAAKLATVEARIEAYEEAAESFGEAFSDFDFETINFEREIENKQDLLLQLADAEQEPLRIAQTIQFVHSVYRHLAKGAWSSGAESPLSAIVAESIARAAAVDSRVFCSIEGYDCRKLIEFGKGLGSTQTIAYKTIAATLKKVSPEALPRK